MSDAPDTSTTPTDPMAGAPTTPESLVVSQDPAAP
jgi:hypothetical protein